MSKKVDNDIKAIKLEATDEGVMDVLRALEGTSRDKPMGLGDKLGLLIVFSGNRKLLSRMVKNGLISRQVRWIWMPFWKDEKFYINEKGVRMLNGDEQ